VFRFETQVIANINIFHLLFLFTLGVVKFLSKK